MPKKILQPRSNIDILIPFRNYNPVERRSKLGKEKSLKGFKKNYKSLQANNSHKSDSWDGVGVDKISG